MQALITNTNSGEGAASSLSYESALIKLLPVPRPRVETPATQAFVASNFPQQPLQIRQEEEDLVTKGAQLSCPAIHDEGSVEV